MDVTVDTSAPVSVFKDQLLKMTGVPIERQKLSCPKSWKGNLSADQNLSLCNLKDGTTVMLMGSADVMAAQTSEVRFIEDMKV